MDDIRHHATAPPGLEPEFEPLTERDLAYLVAQAVADRRNELGWSQGELGVRTGMKQPHISRLESANKLPSLTTLLRIANAMGVKLNVTLEKDQKTL
ncbi:helix-turn-helix transcriptional regulator (plasmid) [Streptomyces sp. NBC_01456]|uniref:helix-turn-helix domain-containing protein n=1 Tax=unclassified Streptomyces TaxID=2593676 RepID=UPI002E351285|nr:MULTISPECIES: helix-turn-helix transcriptional regulator [unclassified Streptomyces]